MTAWSFYRLSDGTFTGRVFSCADPSELRANVPASCGYKQGRYDRHAQRVDIESGEVVADESLIEQQNAVKHRAAALHRISALEIKQARRVRELLAASDPQLQSIDDEITELRKALK